MEDHEIVFTKRPGYGSSGKRVPIRTNFYQIKHNENLTIYHYDVDIQPKPKNELINKIFQAIETRHPGHLFVSDSKRNIFSPKLLDFEGQVINMNLEEVFKNPKREDRKVPLTEFAITVKLVSSINLRELSLYVQGQKPITNACLTAIQALDVLFRYKASLTHISSGRSFFVPHSPKKISGGLEVWRGYYQSCRPSQCGLLVNIDNSVKVFYQKNSLLNFITEALGKRDPNDLQRGLQEHDLRKISTIIKGLQIQINHRASKRKFKIRSVTDKPSTQCLFTIGETETDVASFFQKQYNLRLKFPMLPCVKVQKDNMFPIEVCEIVEGQSYLKKLNERQTADMIKITCEAPAARATNIANGTNILDFKNNQYLKAFNIEVNTDIMIIDDARILNPPSVQYHGSSQEPQFVPRGGKWNLMNKRVFTGASLISWSVISFASDRDLHRSDVEKFVRELVMTCQNTGLNIPNKSPEMMQANPQGGISESLHQAYQRAGNQAKQDPQLILCILPNTGASLYAEIKRVCETSIGVPTQCILLKHAKMAKKQYCANVCLKINAKLGGVNSILPQREIPFVTSAPTIIFGADVSHPGARQTGVSAQEDTRPSIATLVASLDQNASKYASSIREQNNRSEIIENLAEMVVELFKAFYVTSNIKPQRILFYRDGVSEGEFAQVMSKEVSAIYQGCESLEKGYRPPITFIVVQKRHHARFFPINEQDRSGNCPPGTIVESKITHPTYFDFYLQSHAGLQGTCRSSHYHVLKDDNNFTPDALQELTYKLCYLYGRCTAAVSLVPTVYYAHLVANRARIYTTSNSAHSSPVGENKIEVKQRLQRIMYYM